MSTKNPKFVGGVVIVFLLSGAGLAMAQQTQDKDIQVKLGDKGSLTIKGFLSATLYTQDQSFAFGNGQNAEWPTTRNSENKWFNGGDVRNTRLTLDFAGPELSGGWRIGAGIEGDLFSAYNGTGAFSQEQPTPRLRLAYADVKKGGTTVRIGQFWTPLFGEVPNSLSHIAFPLGYGSAGVVGWRFPGVYFYQDLTPSGSKTKIQLDLAAFEGSWSGPGSTIEDQTAGNVGPRVQLEGKINFAGEARGTTWKLYAAGHWDNKDLRGVGDVVSGATPSRLNGRVGELGGSLKYGSFLVHGNIYMSKAAGQQFAAITQFGDIRDWGGWLQLGYRIDPHWDVYGFCGIADPNDNDVRKWVGATGRLKNEQAAFMLEFSLGQYRLGLEYMHDRLLQGLAGGGQNYLNANQVALSVMYAF